jgi:hypothetical protein
MNLPSFEKEGINTNSPLAKRLWQVSRILDKTPWDEEILEMSIPRMDFVIKMHVADNPDKYQLVDSSIEDGTHPLAIQLAWEKVLRGKTLNQFMVNPTKYLLNNYNYKLMK